MPFLCFLANFYVSTRQEDLLKKYSGELSLQDAGFRLWFEKNTHEPKLCVMHSKDAARDLSERLSKYQTIGMNCHPAPPLESKTAAGNSEVGTDAQIELDITIHQETVIRRISYDPDPRVNFKGDVSKLKPSYLRRRQEVRANPVDFDSKPVDGLDVIDGIFSKFYARKRDPWAYHLRKDGQGRKLDHRHILDFIDDCIREHMSSEDED